MPCTGPKGKFFSPGIGPGCDPTAIIVDGGDAARKLIDGYDSVSIENNPQATLGANRKKKCIEDEQKRIAAFIHTCLCDCLSDFTAQGPGQGDGMSLRCFAECHTAAAAEMDWTHCFCLETTFNSGVDNTTNRDTKPNTNLSNSDSTSANGTDRSPHTTVREAALGPNITSIKSHSSYDIYIPKVYNRGQVGGNIIYLSDPRKLVRTVSSSETDTTSGDVTVTNTTVTQTFVDVMIGLCEGPITGVSRVWINDVLIYNNLVETLTSMSVYNFGFFSNIDQQDKYQNTAARISVLNGSEDQLPPVDGLNGMRGLAVLYIENFDLSFTNGTIPAIKVEVIATGDSSSLALESTQNAVITAAPLNVDTSARSVYVGTDVLAYDTLETKGTVPDGVADLATGEYGDAVYLSSTPNVTFFNGSTLTKGGAQSVTDPQSLAVGRLRLVDTSETPAVFVSSATKLETYAIGDFGAQLSPILSLPSDAYRAMFPITVSTSAVTANILAAVYAPFLALDSIRIDGIRLYDTAFHEAFDGSEYALEWQYTIPASEWGGDTDVRYLFSLLDGSDNGLVIFLSNCVFKVNLTTGAVLWNLPLVDSPSGVLRHSAGAFDYVRFVSASGMIYKLSLLSGDLTPDKVVNIAPGTDQFYDHGSDTLTYVDNTMTVVRRFFDRLQYASTPLSSVVRGILVSCGLEDDVIDSSNLDTVLCNGYTITTQTTARSALTQLMYIYGFYVYESEGRIMFRKAELAASTTVFYGETEDVLETEFKDEPLSSIELSYFSMDAYLNQATQTFRVNEERDGATTFSFPVVLSDIEASVILERIAANLTDNLVVSSVTLPPRFLGIEASDYLVLRDVEDKPHSFRIASVSVGADKSLACELILDDLHLYTELPSLTTLAVYGSTTAPDLSAFQPASALRPLLAVTHALENSHMVMSSASAESGVYAAVDYRGADPMPETSLYMYLNGSYTRKASVTEKAHWGTLVEMYDDMGSSFYATDTPDYVVVRFTQSGADAFMIQNADDANINRIIIGKEIIGFRTFTIDGDGVTYTLSNVARGMRGTEWAMDKHAPGQLALLYTPSSVAVVHQTAFAPRQNCRIATVGADGRYAATDILNAHLMLEPYSPSNVVLHTLVTGDMRLEFERRSRFDEEFLNDQQDVFSYDVLLLKESLPEAYLNNLMTYVSAPNAGSHPSVIRWIKAYNLSDFTFINNVMVKQPFFVLYDYPTQQIDGFDYNTDSLYIAVFMKGGGLIARSHPATTERIT